MEVAALKNDLIDRIEHADPNQLKQLYGLMINYFNSLDVIGGEEKLSDYQKKQIEKGLEQADAGLITPFDEVTQKLREKYGLNG